MIIDQNSRAFSDGKADLSAPTKKLAKRYSIMLVWSFKLLEILRLRKIMTKKAAKSTKKAAKAPIKKSMTGAEALVKC
ncbi:MAG: hypothetical protein KC618_03605, partial [Candidatus Omnitrophica bacterium]|nr:hypothetical protein [Candidatus Omnitrophota bacterium]